MNKGHNADLNTKKMELSKEWHPSKNGELKFENISLSSPTFFWWKCEKGHEWEAAVGNRKSGSGCPYCAGKKEALDNCLATVIPELAEEWHPTKNENVTPYDVTIGQRKMFWWKCQKGHEWEDSLNRRTNGRKENKKYSSCPYCTGKRITKENSLGSVNPSLIPEWDVEKNEMLSPYDVFPNAHKKVWWKCEKGHEWEALISSRNKGTGCPYCSGNVVSKENCLAVLNPKLSKEWHPNKNHPLTPNDIALNSNKKVWWICEKEHAYQSPPSNRNKGSKCPYCNNKKACVDNCLTTLNPQIAEQWHPTKNGVITPYDVVTGTSKKYWWLCERGHEWTTSIRHRMRGNGCPKCSNRGTSFPEQALFYYIKQIFKKAENKYLFKNKNEKYELDVFIPEINMGIEYDGFYHKEIKNIKNDERKNAAMEKYGVKLVRIRIVGLPQIKEYNSIVYEHDFKNDLISLKHCFLNLVNYMINTYHLGIDILNKMEKLKNLDIEKDRFTILASYRQFLKEKSIAFTHPHLLNEWHPIKNENLSPEHFTFGSEEKVWWICSKNHEFRSKICGRTSGNGCPYCAGRKVSSDNNFAIVYPQLIQEWHPTKNQGITPYDVTPMSHKKAWWMCEKGHEWNAIISSRFRSNCPYCSNYKAFSGNCLSTLNPEVAKEWHPTKNGKITPNDVVAGSGKKAWWKCEKGHEWEAKIESRNKGSKCPYCVNQKVCLDNCLDTVYPHLLEEWHPTKNGDVSPYDVVCGSMKKVWWKSACGHEWEAKIHTRTRGTNCPYCIGKKVDENNCLATLNAQEWHPTKNKG